jgi:hypothetical protein
MSIYPLPVLFFVCFTVQNVFCRYSISGKIVEQQTGKAIEYASVVFVDRDLWTVGNEKGEFTIRNVEPGELNVAVSCLGYAGKIFSLKVTGDMKELEFRLQKNSLALEEVTVTAKRKDDDPAAACLIDQTSLEHMQILSISDAMSLLPGGQTRTTLHLATSSPQPLAIHAMTGENGNPTFGTAIEVDGVRLSENAAFKPENTTAIIGADTRNIASGNIASIEVITGIPSAEYGDMTNGIVKIHTRKGKSPFVVEMTAKPNTKHVSLGKGFALRNGAGTLNLHAEHTRSIADPASPYTSYDRNTVSLAYSNTFNRKGHSPVFFESGLTGNVGGYDSKKDPDLFSNEYTRAEDHTLRANIKLRYLLNKPWITHLEASAGASYSDKRNTENRYKNNSIATPASHGTEEGYFNAVRYDDDPRAPVVLILPEASGYWYQRKHTDSKPLNISAGIKARWARTFGKINNHVLAGADFSSSKNNGKGVYYDDLSRTTDTWREYRYDQLPSMNNIALYAEEKITIPIARSRLQLVAGIRSDNTVIRHSAYGAVGSLSPRFNAKFTGREKPDQFVRKIALRAGWGKTCKLPSFEVLFPRPYYSDIPVFSDGTLNKIPVYAYYIRPYAAVYNPGLRRQYAEMYDSGIEMKLRGVYITLSAYSNKTVDAYTANTNYTPFAFKQTASIPETFPIARENRLYHIDRQTGIVTVSDKTGLHPAQTLPYTERKTFKSNTIFVNGSPTMRRGLEWSMDFDKIRALQTSVRLDGSYYHYRSTEETVGAFSPSISNADAERSLYRYVGFYAGGNNAANGRETRRLTSNLTVTTHIPAIRLIVSLRLEGTFYHYTQNLSEYGGAQRSFLLDGKESYFPSSTATGSIYNRNRFTGLYPLYYVSYDDMNTKIPFAEKFAWAYDNNRALYEELLNLVVKPTTDYYFNKNKISGYYSANISVTKEIGNIASISFNAINFTNNMQQVHSSANDTHQTIYENGSNYIPRFYYGLSLKLKF